ncbi:hypothetical protein [Micromonospora sp. NPDC049204]|uniref:hypothetical protein n=1 Tax=unclassified Micromonospora TaxID=2617518 RepID=UPI0033E85FD7
MIAFQALGGLPVSGTVDGRVLDALSGEPIVPATWPEDRIGKHLRRVGDAPRSARGPDGERPPVHTD